MKNVKRFISFILTLCMVLSLVPAVSFGASAADSYVKTDLSAIGATDKVVITMTASDGKTYALTSSKGTSAAPTAVVVTVSGNNLSGTITNDLLWNISKSGNDLTFYPDGDTSKWLYCTASNNGVRVGTNANKVFTLDASSGYLKNTATSRYVGVYTSNPDWRCYTSTTTNIGGQTLAFYKLEAGNTPDPEYTVTFSTPDGVTAPNAVTGSSVDLPTLGAYEVDGKTYTFVGWTTGTHTDVTTKPATVASPYEPSQNITLHALYSWEETTSSGGAASGYKKVTSAPSNWAGTYLIVYEDGNVALNGSLTTVDAASNTVEVSISNNTIASSATVDAATVTVEATTDGYSIKTASGYYIGQTSDANGIKSSTSTAYANSLALNSDGTVNIVSSGAYLRYNATAGQYRFRYYKSSSYTGQKAITLYKLESGSGSTTTTYWTTEIEIADAPCLHTNTTTTTEDATCTTPGSTTVTCDDCGEVISTNEIAALGHNYVDGSCSVCGEADPNYTPDTPDTPDPTDYSGRYYIATNRTSGNYWYMTNDLGTASTKRYQAEDSGLTTLPTAIETPVIDKVFVVERNADGTYRIYAEGIEGDNYLGWSSGNSGTLVAQDSAKNVTIAGNGEEGLVNISFTSGAETRYLSLNEASGSDYFAWYKGTQLQNLALIPVEGSSVMNKITVTLVCPEGVSAESITAEAGESITLPVPTGAPIDSGYTYTFQGWADREIVYTATLPSAATVYSTDESISFSEDTTLYALFSYVEDEVTYYTTITPILISLICPDGVTAESIHTTTGTVFTLPTPDGAPANNVYDFTFVGWVQNRLTNTETAPEYAAAGTRFYADTDLTYYPLFSRVSGEKTYYTTINPMTVTFSCPVGVSAEAIDTTTGTVYTLPVPEGTPVNPAKEYTFAGWVTAPLAATSEAPSIIAPGSRYGATGNFTYYALYTYTEDSTTYYTTRVQRNSTVYLIDSKAELIDGYYLLMADATAASLSYSGYYMLQTNVDGYAVLSSGHISYETVPEAFTAPSTILWRMIPAADGTVTIQDANGSYLTDTSGDDGVGLSLLSTPYKWTPELTENGTFTLKSADGRYLSLRHDLSNVDSDGDPVFCLVSNVANGCSYFHLYKEACLHTETTTQTVPPTCTEDGSETVSCAICGEVISTTVLPATGHSFVDSGEDRDGLDVYVCSVCGAEELRDNVTASIKIITGEGKAWFEDSEGNIYPLVNEADDTQSAEASQKAATYRAEVPKNSTVTLVMMPDSDYRLSCVEKGSSRLTAGTDYVYNSEKGYFTCEFTASETQSQNFFRITFLPRLADGGYVAVQSSEAADGDFITPGLYVMTGMVSPEKPGDTNKHDVDTTYLLYADEYTVLDDNMRAVGRKSSALRLSRVGVFLDTNEPYRMTAVNKNHLVNIQPYGDTGYYTMELGGATGYYLKSIDENNLLTTTKTGEEMEDAALWTITYLSDGSYEIINKQFPDRHLRFNSTTTNLQFRTYAPDEHGNIAGHAPVLYRATKASQKVTYSVVTGNDTGSIRAMNTSTASVIASGTYQGLSSVLNFTFTPAFGYMLEKVEVNGVAVEVTDGSYTCTVEEGKDIDVQVWYTKIPANNEITVYFYVNEVLQEGHTITDKAANSYILNLEGLPEVPINGVNYKYSELSFNYAENKTTGEIYPDIHAAILVDNGHEIHVYFTTTKVTLNKTATETTDRNYTVDDTNGGVNSENFTDNNEKDTHGNVKQSFEVTLSAQSFDKGEDISYGNTDVIVVLDNSNSMHFKDSQTVAGALSAASSTENRLSIVGADAVDNNAVWTISIDGLAAVVQSKGSYTRNTLAYDSQSKEFSAYASNNSMRQVIIWRYNSSTQAFENVTDVSALQDRDIVTFTDFYYDSSNNPVYSVYMDAGMQNENGAHPPITTSSPTNETVFTLLKLDNGGYMFYSAATKIPGKTNAEYTMAALDSFYDQVFEIPGNRIGFVKFETEAFAWNGSSYVAYSGSQSPSSYSLTYESCFVDNKADATIASNAAIAQKETSTLGGATNMVGAWLMTYTLSNLFDGTNGRDLVVVFFTDGMPTATYVTDSEGYWSTSTVDFQHSLETYTVPTAAKYSYGEAATAEGTYSLAAGTYPFIGEGGMQTSATEYHDALYLAQLVRNSLQTKFGTRFSIHNIGLFNEYADASQKIDYPELINNLLCARAYDPQGNLTNQTKQWNTEEYPRSTQGSVTSTSSKRHFFTTDIGYIRVMKDNTTRSYFTYGDAGEYLSDTTKWVDTEPYADSYVSVTGNVEAELEAAFAAIGEITIPGKRVNGTITDIIPANFKLTEESKEALENIGWTVDDDTADGTTILTSPVVTADEDGESFTYEIVYQGYGYGVEYTNDLATYTYNGVEDGENKEYTAYFPMPAVDVIPWTVNDGYTADTNIAVTLDLFKNDLFKELSAGGYAISNLTVTLTDANGNPVDYQTAQVGGFDAFVDPASNTVSFMTEVGGTHTFYYVVSAEVTDPEGNRSVVYSRATRVDVFTATAQTVSDVDLRVVGEAGAQINILANDSFGFSASADVSHNVVLTGADGQPLKLENLTFLTNAKFDQTTGILTYTAAAKGVEQFWYTDTVTVAENGNTIRIATPPTKVTILVVDDDALVVDYGYKTETIRAHADLANYIVDEGVTLSAVIKVVYPDGEGDYGNATFSAGSFTYQPTTTMFAGVDSYAYEVQLLNTIYSIRAENQTVAYNPAVTVVPANSVHYEESFLNYATSSEKDLNGNALVGWSVEGKAADRTQSAANELYGYDNVYALQESYSGGSAMSATVTEANPTAVAYFSFSGTGFDLYGLSSKDTGFLLAEIYTFDAGKTNNLGTLKKYVMVDTYIENKTYDQLPILCCRDLPYGNYAVKLRVVYEKAFDHNLTSEDKATVLRNEDYYRRILGLQEGIEMEIVTADFTSAPATRVATAAKGSYSILLDGIRIYQPLGATPEDPTAGALYEAAGETGLSFFRIRDLLLSYEKWADTANTVSGLVYIAASDLNGGISDKPDADESESVYLTPTQSFVLEEENGRKYLIDAETGDRATYVDETDGKAYDIYVTVVKTVDDNGNPGWANEFRYEKDGEEIVISADWVREQGFMRLKNYYEAIGPKYELYLTNGNGIAFTATADQLLHLSMKVPEGERATLQAYVNGQWVDAATVTSRTEMYYDLSNFVNSDGSVIIRCSAAEGTVLSLCNIKTASGITVTQRSIRLAAAAFEGPVVENGDGFKMGHSVNLESELKVNYRVKYTELAALVPNYVAEGAYLVVEKDCYPAGGASVVKTVILQPDFSSDPDRMIFVLEGLDATEMGNELRATLHFFDTEGNQHSAPVDVFSIRAYADLCFRNYENPALYTMLMDMLNYGAAAQLVFDRRTDVLVNAGLHAYQQYATTELTSELTASRVYVDNDRALTAVTAMGFSVNLADRIELNAKLSLAEGYTAEDITCVKVFDQTGKLVDTITDLSLLSNGKLQATFHGVQAVNMRDMFYFEAYVGEEVASQRVGYSVEAFAKSVVESGNADLTALILACMYYGDSAKAYFEGTN